MTDTLHTQVSFITGTDCIESTSGEVTCTVASIAAGGSYSWTFTVLADADIESGSSLENVAEVGSETADSNPFNNTDDADTSIVGLADVEVQKVCGDAVAGETVSCDITVINHGPSVAQDVDVKDLLPEGMEFVSGNPPQGRCVNPICQLGDVAVNENDPMVFQITSLVESDVLPGDLQNEVTVFSDTIDDDPTNDSATGTVTVTTLADVGVTKVDLKEPVGPTEGFLYELEVTNYGPSVALNVVATDDLDENVTFSSASEDCVHNGTNPGGVVTCTTTSMEVGETVDYLIAVTVNDVNVESVNNLYNQVSVDADTPEDPGDLENNTDDENTEVETPLGPVADLEIGKTGDPASVIAGELVTYTLTVTNTGPSVATNVRVLELIPYGTTAVSLEADNPDVDVTDEHCSLGGTCYLGKMEVDATATVEVVLRVNADYEGDEIKKHGQCVRRSSGHDPR